MALACVVTFGVVTMAAAALWPTVRALLRPCQAVPYPAGVLTVTFEPAPENPDDPEAGVRYGLPDDPAAVEFVRARVLHRGNRLRLDRQEWEEVSPAGEPVGVWSITLLDPLTDPDAGNPN